MHSEFYLFTNSKSSALNSIFKACVSMCESVFAHVRESDKMRKRERERIVATQGFGCQFGSKIFDNFFLIATRLWLLQASDRMLFVAWFEKKNNIYAFFWENYYDIYFQPRSLY